MRTLHPAAETYMGIPGYLIGWILTLLALIVFGYILYRRYQILLRAQTDMRFHTLGRRVLDLISYGLIQKRQPRYLWAGVIHIMIFWGFMVLALRSLDLITQGLGLPLLHPIMAGGFGVFYSGLKDVFELIVLWACVWAVLRRTVLRPERYKGSPAFEAYLVLALIAFLMITDMIYEGSKLLLAGDKSSWLPAARLTSLFLPQGAPGILGAVYHGSYWLHLLCFFFFLDFLPLGKHFHIITALPNIFFRNLKKGAIKPVSWSVEDLEKGNGQGIEKLEDFTWKHVLDFFTCTECGRCSDVCPANTVGRSLSPKMMTLKLRDYAYSRYPLFKRKGECKKEDDVPLVGGVVSLDEIWSCTTCGACEEECPVFIEYIDKVIDMRRHLIESAQNPKTFNQVLMHFEKTGNPFGKPPGKRADWIQEVHEEVPVKVLEEGDEVDVLYFVDSYGSYDPEVQAVASNIVRGLHRAGVDFGILGSLEMDSGHQARRIGEEGLFQFLMENNMETFKGIRFKRMITTDPHAFNTLKKDYPESFEVFHYSQFFWALLKQGALKPARPVETDAIYTYHDPCYLGRHNGIYDEPREILKALPGLRLVEMERCRDRSFCCGGGDIILWHEVREEIRIAERRIQMAREIGANVVVTACPFCLIHFQDAIKTQGLETEMKAVDLMELLLSVL